MQIFIVDDDQHIASAIEGIIEPLGHRSTIAHSGSELRLALAKHQADLIFLDYRLGNENGLDLIKPILAEQPDAYIVMITAHACLDIAVSAMKLGAKDFLKKPFGLEEVELLVNRVAETKSLKEKVFELQDQLGT